MLSQNAVRNLLKVLSSQAPGLELLATTKIKKGNGNHIQHHKLVSLTVG